MNISFYRNFDLTIDALGVATVTLDMPDRPLNVLDREMLIELELIIHDIENSDDVRVVVFQSGKESGFLAGADVNAIAKIESASQAMRVIESGQTLFQRIEWLPMPTIAVIHGPCMGGGLELALACKYRVARDNSSTKIGLPEISLGLIPGWGGTQRLPRRVGLQNALSMILTGKSVSAQDAHQMGLVDRAISPQHWQTELDDFIQQALSDRVPNSAAQRPHWKRLLERSRLGRAVILRMAERSVASKVKHYPALAAALRAIRCGYEKGPHGFLCERDEFVDLLATPTCRHLLELFFARERARNLQTWSPSLGHSVYTAPIRRVGVVGAGAMGAGIAQLAALRGYDVAIKEIGPDAVEAGRRRIRKLVDRLADRKNWSPSQRDALLDKVTIACDDGPLVDCDLIIEAVVEREEVKHQLFASLDKVVQPSAILASNTSSLSVTRMAEATGRPQKVAGIHFFNPVHRMELVEVVRAAGTDEATIGKLVAFVKSLGKTPVVTADAPGFLVNRVLFPYLGEAVRMVGEGFDVANLDRQIRRFGMPMGPLELLDQVGLDVALHVAGSLSDVLPDVAPVVDALGTMVDHGHLGKKSGSGFYLYRKGKRGDVAVLPWDRQPLENLSRQDFLEDGLTPVQRRLVYPMLREAVRCYEDRVVEEPWAIDLAMVLGTGFAPHRGGPLHVVDSIGVRQVMGNLRRLRSRHGNRYSPPKGLIAMSAKGHSFFHKDDTVEKQLGSAPQHGSINPIENPDIKETL